MRKTWINPAVVIIVVINKMNGIAGYLHWGMWVPVPEAAGCSCTPRGQSHV